MTYKGMRFVQLESGGKPSGQYYMVEQAPGIRKKQRRITDPEQFLAAHPGLDIPVMTGLQLAQIAAHTAGGNVSAADIGKLIPQYEQLFKSREKPPADIIGKPGADKFRARSGGESLNDYLVAKKSWEEKTLGKSSIVLPEVPPATPEPGVTPPAEAIQTYKIQSGDTLSALAAKYGTTVDALMAANPQIKDPNLIYAGANLNIPGPVAPPPGAPPGGGAGAPPPGGPPPGGPPPGNGGLPGEGEVIDEPNVKTLSFNLDDLITGEFDTDDLINIFSSPITDQDIDKLLKENLGLRQQFLDSLKPSDEEIQLKSDLVDLRSEIETKKLEFRGGIADIQQELVSTRVMVGKEEALFTQAQLGMQTLAMQESNLFMRLGLEQDAREASSKVLAATLEFNEADLTRMQTMQNQIWNQKMGLYNIMSQLSIRAQNTLNIVLDGLVGLDAGDLDSGTVTKLQSLTKASGIPWSVVQQAMKVKKDEYSYNQYMGDLDKRLKQVQLEKLETGETLDFTDSQKLKLEQAGIDWTNPVGRQEALDYLYKEGPEDVAEMMEQYKDLIQQYKDNNFSKEDAESLVRSENGIKEDEDIPGPYQDVIDTIYAGGTSEEGWTSKYEKWAKDKAWYKPWTWLQ